MGILYKEERKRPESFFKEIITDNLPNLGKKGDIQIQKAEGHQIIWSQKYKPRHIKITLIKDKERILKASRENDLSHAKNLHSSSPQDNQ